MIKHPILAAGGIGGLATALALAQAGQPVTLMERADRLAEIGAGIRLGSNAFGRSISSAWATRRGAWR